MNVKPQRWIPLLTGLLAVQVAMAVGLGFMRPDRGAFRPDEPLLRFDAERVDEIRIQEGDDAVLLRKQGAIWRLPDHFDFEADAKQVERLLDRLEGLQKGWPVASTSGAAERFRVADDDFERRILLLAEGETLAELLVGTSPGLRKVHVRAVGSDEIHAVELAAYDAPSDRDEWIDNLALGRASDALSRVQVGDLDLVREGEGWVLPGLADDEQTVSARANTLIAQVTQLRVDSVLGTDPDAAYAQAEPALQIVLHPKEGEPVTLTFSRPEPDGDFVVRASDRPHYLGVPSYSVEAIQEIGREQLVEPRSAEPASTPGADETSPSPEEPSEDEAPDDAGAASP